MNLFHKETLPEKAVGPLTSIDPRTLAKTGLTAGATVIVLSAASAAASAVRRRVERR